MLQENVYANNIHMNLTQQKSNENHELTTTTNTNGAENNHAFNINNQLASTAGDDGGAENSLPAQSHENKSVAVEPGANDQAPEENKFFTEYFESQSNVCSVTLLELLQADDKEEKNKTAEFVLTLSRGEKVLWVYMGIAAALRVFNKTKSRGGSGKKESVYLNAMKEVVEVINRKDKNMVDGKIRNEKSICAERLNKYRLAVWAYKKQELKKIFASVKNTVPPGGIVLSEAEIRERLRGVVENLTRFDMTFYYEAASTINPREAIQIAIDKTSGRGRVDTYTTNNFISDIAHLKIRAPKEKKPEVSSPDAPSAADIMNSASTSQNTNLFIRILSKVQGEEPRQVLFRCLSKYDKFLDEILEIQLLGKGEKLVALKP